MASADFCDNPQRAFWKIQFYSVDIAATYSNSFSIYCTVYTCTYKDGWRNFFIDDICPVFQIIITSWAWFKQWEQKYTFGFNSLVWVYAIFLQILIQMIWAQHFVCADSEVHTSEYCTQIYVLTD